MSSFKSQNSLDVTSTNYLWHTLSRDTYYSTREDDSKGILVSHAPSKGETTPLIGNETIQEEEEGENSSKKKVGANWVMTSFLLISTALGIGLLNFPAAYNQAGGILAATVIQLVMVCLMMSTMVILAYCSDLNGDSTYHDVLLSMCGKRAQQMAAVSITVTLYCVCIASFIIIGDQLDSLFRSVYDDNFCDRWYLERHFTIPVSAVIFILPMCYCKRVDFLSYAGSLGIFAMLYPVFLTVYVYFYHNIQPGPIKTKPDDITAMFAVIPILGLGYQCQEVVVPVYACMRERNICNFVKSSILAMIFLLVIYSVTGIFGYLTFGANVAHNLMKMYDAKDPIVMIGVGALILKMIVTYPILALCGRDAVGGIYAEFMGITSADYVKSEKKRRYVIASIWFSSSLALAILTSGIGVVIKYLGSVASANIFIYPGICLLRVVLKKHPKILSWKNKFFVVFAVFITAFGAFCLGVVLLQAILSNDDESSKYTCT